MGSPPAEELLKKIQELEAGQARLKQEMAKLMPGSAASGDEDRRLRLRSLSASPRRSREPQGRRLSLGREHGRFGNYSSPLQRESLDLNPPSTESAMAGGRSSLRGGSIGLSERHHLQILQAMGQSIHISDVEGRIIFWNRSAEHLYGFSATEALGQKATELLVDPCNFDLAAEIESRVLKWGSWSGKLPVKNKREEEFVAMATITPFYDDVDKKLIGMICVSCNSQYFQESSSSSPASSFIGESGPGQTRFSLRSKVSSGSQQPLQATIASKLSNLAIKVTNKGRLRTKGTSEGLERETAAVNGCSDTVSLDQREDGASSGASTPRGDSPSCSFSVPRKAAEVNSEETEGKMGIHKMISAKAEAWIAKKSLSWPWKGQEHEADETKNRFVWPWLQHDPENESSLSKNAESSMRQDNQPFETTRVGNNEATGSWSSSVSSNGSTSSSAVQKLDLESDCLDYEILWEDLVIGEQIGQGSCGTVYHALWYGSDVAVKVFSKMEYSEEVISSFKQEVSLMKRLRHPNILLFMGSVTSPQRLCIVTEFLPRGSLFRLLQRATTKLDRRRRVNMALDIARGVNYLHHCNPPIFHRDLKSSNLLVDKNWTVKVGDFGLSRLKRETYLTSNTGKGTPQWMAPEVLRNEHADEKSDVYSYGVVLWELVTEKIPWDNLNSMQVIGAVGFMNQRLEFPEDLDPRWVSIISSCWHSEPNLRPTFQELIEKLKDLQRHYSLQSQLQRSSLGGNRKPPSE